LVILDYRSNKESPAKTENAGSRVSDKPPPADQQLRELAENLVKEQSTMTFATASGDAAWAAPVYYANMEFNFYFFSDPNSRHIQESLKSNQASAAIFHQSSTWREIRGIQMSGIISPVSVGIEAFRMVRAYLKKFPFTEEFFDQGQKLDLEAFAKRFRVRLYRFKPDLIYYMDNRIRFSFREKIRI
jgi:uncharacterized protein YhbP (UPF0306 family)